MRRIGRAFAAAAAALWAGAAAAELPGRYDGLDAAEGMRLEIARAGDGYAVTLTTPSDGRQSVAAPKAGDGAEARATLGGAAVHLRILPEPLGVSVLALPVDARGLPTAEGGRALAFLREGVDPPPRPTRWVPPPAGAVKAVDAAGFVSSYPFWPAEAALWGYEALEPRFRSVIKLYPLIQADLLWKLCASPRRSPAIAEALRGQGASCEDVAAAMRRTQERGRFDRFKADAEVERKALMETLLCADDLRRTDADCKRAGAETAKRAVSMETAASALARYR
jgi:hypothetical protein